MEGLRPTKLTNFLDRKYSELKEKLEIIRPTSLDQAGRIDGMTPVAINLILARLKYRDQGFTA